jgi:hypothetical protein
MSHLSNDVRRLPVLVLGLLATLLATACENPASPGRHLQAYGVIVLEGQTELIRASGDVALGSLTVPAGHQRGPLGVTILDRDGNPLALPEGYWLRVTSAAQGTARWAPTVEGAFAGALVGVSPGTAMLEFCLMHGAVGRGHEDGCQVVPVSVEPT